MFVFGVSRLLFSFFTFVFAFDFDFGFGFGLSRGLENAVRSASVHRSRGAEKARSSRCGVLPSFRITKCRLFSDLSSVSAFRFRIAAACDTKWSKSAPGFPRIYGRMHACVVARTRQGSSLRRFAHLHLGSIHYVSFCVMLCLSVYGYILVCPRTTRHDMTGPMLVRVSWFASFICVLGSDVWTD